MNLEEKCYNANKLNIDLLAQLRDTSDEFLTLQRYIADLQFRIPQYKPVKNDKVDNMLADFINNYPDKAALKINFKREKEGQYLFGTQRVNIIEMQNKLKTKVAGGMIDLQEYMNDKIPTELAKLERKDPLNQIFGQPSSGGNANKTMNSSLNGINVSPLKDLNRRTKA